MSHARIVYPDALRFILFLRLHDGFTALEARLWSAKGTMYEIQADVTQTARLEGLVDRLGRLGFTTVRFRLGDVKDIKSLETVVVDELADGAPAALLAVISTRGVLEGALMLQVSYACELVEMVRTMCQ